MLTMSIDTALGKAAATFGSQKRLATAIGVTEGCIWQWRQQRPVPLERCIQIEAATRRAAAERNDASLVVTCEELRPDVQWKVLREHPPKAVA